MSDDDSVAECNENSVNMPQEMDHLAEVDVTDRNAMRCKETGQFIKGWKGGGRKKGSKDKLNQQVIATMERLWSQRGDEIMDHLASEKPEVLAGLVARLIPQSLAAEAITGEAEKAQANQDVTIRLVSDQRHEVLPSREVQGELMPPKDGDNVTH